MSKDTKTIQFYNREAATYTADTAPKAPPAPLVSFARHLPENASVLDLGCGGGWASVMFSQMGHTVAAMDASAGMIAEVSKLTGITAYLKTFEEIDWRDEFDGIWASFSLQHADRTSMPGTLARLHRALKPGGWLYIGIHEGDETLRDPLGRLYCHYTEADLAQMLAEAGFRFDRVTRENSKGYDGRAIDCMHIEAQK